MGSDVSGWEPVKPEGLARTLLVVTIIMTIFCVIIFGLRLWVRIRTALFDLEDYLMCIGMTLNMVHNGLVIYGCYTGIGTPDSKMGTATMIEGAKIVLLWQVFYVSGSVFIKWSICATLMRIAIQRKFIFTLWGLVAITILANTVALCAALARCRPIQASWNPSLGTCLSQSIIITLTYVVSAVNIFTDWGVAIIPVFILWNIQMRLRLKLLTGGILGIGVLASIATIVRILYSNAYNETVNELRDIGNIILWTVLECGLGIIAGSLPMLRALIKGLAKDVSSNNDRYRQFTRSGDTDLVTFGRIRVGHNRALPGGDNAVTTVVADGDSNEELDSESTRNIITVTRQYDMSRSERNGKDFELGRLGT